MLNPLNLVKKIFKSHNQSELDRIKKIVKTLKNRIILIKSKKTFKNKKIKKL